MNKRKIHIVTVVLVILLLFCTTMTCLAQEENINAQAISLYDKNPKENIPFQMTNMFPGDSKTQYYRVSVSYTGTITVSFQALVKEGKEGLGKALSAKVKLLNTDEVLYEGIIADMPRLDHTLTTETEAQTQELCYEIIIILATDVTNEYQNCNMTADLSWWVEGSGSEEPPETEEPLTPSEDEEPSKPSEYDSTKPSEEELAAPSEEENDKSEAGSLVAPNTGDNSHFAMWLVMSVVIVVVLPVMIRYRRNGQDSDRRSLSRLLRGILLGVLLAGGLGITTLALIYEKVSVEDNYFATGTVSVCLNDNQPIFDEAVLFEPGMIIKKEFTLRNDSTCDVYYKLYFSELDGELAEALTVVVADGKNTIYRCALTDMEEAKAEEANGLLREGEERRMTITFYVPEECDNSIQDQTIWFDLHVDAVQAVNNPDGLFK